MNYNPHSLDTICSALAYAMGIDAPEKAQEKNPDLSGYVDSALGGEKVKLAVGILFKKIIKIFIVGYIQQMPIIKPRPF